MVQFEKPVSKSKGSDLKWISGFQVSFFDVGEISGFCPIIILEGDLNLKMENFQPLICMGFQAERS